MVFATPDDPKRSKWRPPVERRRASAAFTYQMIEQMLEFTPGSTILSIRPDDNRGIVSVLFEHPDLPVVHEGQECPEILAEDVHLYAESVERREPYVNSLRLAHEKKRLERQQQLDLGEV